MSRRVVQLEKDLQLKINHLQDRKLRLYYVLNNGILLTEKKKDQLKKELWKCEREIQNSLEYKSRVF